MPLPLRIIINSKRYKLNKKLIVIINAKRYESNTKLIVLINNRYGLNAHLIIRI